MERTKNVQEEKGLRKPLWKKIGGGSLRIGKRIIKPGQTFEADPEEISKAFRRFVIPLSGDAVFTEKSPSTAPEPPPEKIVKPKYSLKERPGYTMELKGKSPLWYTVLNAENEVMTEKAVKKADAEKMIAEQAHQFDVIDAQGKVVNEAALEKDFAEQLIKDLLK